MIAVVVYFTPDKKQKMQKPANKKSNEADRESCKT